MPVASIGPADALPRSHIFLSVAHGVSIRTIRMRVATLRALVAGGVLLVGWLIASSVYLAFHDDLVAALIAREAATQYAYEDRIAALRGQVEHEASLKLVGQTTLEGKLTELAKRAGLLEQRASLLAAIGARTGTPVARGGIGAAVSITQGTAGAPAGLDNPDDGEPTGSIIQPLGGASSHPLAVPAKPHPEDDSSAADVMPAPRVEASLPAFRIRLAAVEERLERIDAAQFRGLAVMREAARTRAEALRTAIADVGLSPDRLVPQADSAQGGPFVPLDPAITHSSFGQAVDAMRADVTAAGDLTKVLPHIPFATPIPGTLEVTSPFGARLDPFLGRPAMHTGVDLRDDYGAEVRATAAGRVVSAGPAGGYGTMVEIDHGHGLSTRYAHLSSVEVNPGEVVEKGAVIGEVGATGRATGPHLHYETRIDGEAVDPVRFLDAGSRLAALSIAP